MITTTFAGTLDSLTDSDKAAFMAKYKTQVAASSDMLSESDIVSVTLAAGSLLATARLKPTVPQSTVVRAPLRPRLGASWEEL